MIYCPECGTANREGSYYCNNCGAQLARRDSTAREAAVIRCPMCNAANPSAVDECQRCGARLRLVRLANEGEKEDRFPTGVEEPAAEELPGIEKQQEPSVPEATQQPVPEEPDWLQRLRAAAFGARVLPEAEEDVERQVGEMPSETPELLGAAPEQDELGGAQDWIAEVPEIREESLADAALPSWLQKLISSEAEPKPEVEAGPEEGERAFSSTEIPDWLRQIVQAEKPEEAEAPVGEAQGVEPLEVAAKESEIVPPPLETRDFILETAMPDWLREAAEGPVALSGKPAEEEPEEELPAWLQELVPIEEEVAAEPEEEEMQPLEESALPPVEIPDWLQELKAAREPEISAEGTDEAQEGGLVKPEIPEWLRDLAPAGAAKEEPSDLAKAQIPDWLEAVRPSSATLLPRESEPLAEGTGVLAGIRGVLPVETVWSEPRRAQESPMAHPAPRASGAVELFADILAGQAEERPVSVPRPRQAEVRGLTRVLIYLFLVISVVIPFFFGREWFSQGIVVSHNTRALRDLVDDLPAGTVVLLVFDYDPTTAAELDLQAEAIMRHLLDRRARLLAISLIPQGPPLAQAAWERVARSAPHIYGQDFLNLGYLAGQEAGLRLLFNDLQDAFPRDFKQQKLLAEQPLMQNVQSLQDVSLIVILASEPASVRRWIEQVQSICPIRMVAGVSALAGPSVLPYRESGQLSGLLIGVSGAAEYEVATDNPSLGVSSVGSQSLAHIVVILVILAGNLVTLAAWMKRGK